MIITQSMLKDFDKLSLTEFKERWIDGGKSNQTSYFTLGSYVDALFFSPEKLGDFIKTTMKLPPATIQLIFSLVWKEGKKFKDSLEELYLESVNQGFGGGKWGKEAILKRLSSYESFWESLESGKKLISADDVDKANRLVKKLKGLPLYNTYFKDSFLYENLFQEYIEAGDKGGTLDIHHISIEEGKEKHRVVDLKTSFDGYNFKRSIEKYGYLTQLSYYSFLVTESLGLSVKSLLPPLNIVLDTISENIYVYEYDLNDIVASRYGTVHIEGWEKIYQRLKLRLEMDNWEMFAEEKGEIIKLKLNEHTF